MIEEKSFISSFDIRPDGQIQLRKTNQVLKDGKVIAETFWRTVLIPGQSINDIDDPYYLSLIQAAWTDEIIKKHQKIEEIAENVDNFDQLNNNQNGQPTGA